VPRRFVEQLTVRLTKEEADVLTEIRRETGLKRAEAVRCCIQIVKRLAEIQGKPIGFFFSLSRPDRVFRESRETT